MSQHSLSTTQQIILSALSYGIKGEKYLNCETSVNWQEVLKECKLQAVSLSFFDALNQETNILGETLEEFELHCAKQISHNMTIHTQHNYLHNLMVENGIDYVVLKGSTSAYYYKNPILRAMGDVDFFVSREDIERAKDVLLKDGFALYEDKHISHLVFKKGKMHFEMHFNLPGMPEGKFRNIINNYLEDVFEKSREANVEGLAFKKPCDFHHGLILLMHTYHHMLGEGIGLRHLCDIACFINSFKENGFEEAFREKLETCGLWHFTKILAYTCYKYLKIDKKDFMNDDLEDIAAAVIEDIFAGGNFGKKDSKRKSEALAISDRGKDGVKKSAHLQFIKSVNNAAKVQFPFINKHKFLHPVGFVAFILRRGFRVLKGSRKMPNFKGAIKGAKKRKEIYSQFRLFEGEDK